MQVVDIAVSLLLALLNFVLLVLCWRAYRRRPKKFLFPLGIGCLALACANALTAAIYIYSATKLRVVPMSVVEATYVVQIACGTIGGVLSFLGTVLLISFAFATGFGVQT
jgi:hypothetical protein